MGKYNRGGGEAARKLKAEKLKEQKDKAQAKLPSFRGLGEVIYNEDGECTAAVLNRGLGSQTVYNSSGNTDRRRHGNEPAMQTTIFKVKADSLSERAKDAPSLNISKHTQQLTRAALDASVQAQADTQALLSAGADTEGALFSEAAAGITSNVVSLGTKLSAITAESVMTVEVRAAVDWHEVSRESAQSYPFSLSDPSFSHVTHIRLYTSLPENHNPRASSSGASRLPRAPH